MNVILKKVKVSWYGMENNMDLPTAEESNNHEFI